MQDRDRAARQIANKQCDGWKLSGGWKSGSWQQANVDATPHTLSVTHIWHTSQSPEQYFTSIIGVPSEKNWVWTPDSGGGRCPSRAFSKCFSYRISIKIWQGLGHSVHSAPQSDHRLHKVIPSKREIPSLETHIITISVFFTALSYVLILVCVVQSLGQVATVLSDEAV